MKKILAPVDFSDVSGAVIRTAADLAQALGGELRLVHAVAARPVATGLAPECACLAAVCDPAETEEALRARAARLEALAEPLRAGGLRVEARAVRGEATEAILAEIQSFGADILVLGSHGHGALYHLLLGGVADALLRRAPCPTLLVHCGHGEAAVKA